MYRFDIGQTVKILEDFDKHRYLNDPGIEPDMYKYRGQTYIIKSRWTSNAFKPMYELENNRWTWDQRWLEPVKEIEINENEMSELFGL